MHEYAISSSIARTVINSAEGNRARKVTAINLEMGELVFLNPEQVKFWLKELFRETIAKEAKINIKNIKSLVRCPQCGYQGEMKSEDDPIYHISYPSFSCPKCRSPQIEIERGRECLLRNIEILTGGRN